MTNQKLNIEAIAGIREIDDAEAANCNGGMGAINLFFEANLDTSGDVNGFFTGRTHETLTNVAVSDGGIIANDRITSIAVNEGRWALYEDANFEGESIVLSAGDVINQLGVNLDNKISSIRRLDE